MAVDPINRIPHYQVTHSAETNDEDRRRERAPKEEPSRNRRKPRAVTKEFQPDLLTTAAPTPENHLPSQVIDTEKVVELLSTTPRTPSTVIHSSFHTVNKLKSTTVPPSAKKLNKAL